MGIAGFHGHDISQVMTPRLATVITPREEIGVTAATELLKRLNGEPITGEVIDLKYSVDMGESL